MSQMDQSFLQGLVPNATKIQRIIAPLIECLDISFFSYGSVESDGRSFGMANRPEVLEVYFRTKGYLIDPHLSHPHLLRSGCLLLPDSFNAHYVMDAVRDKAKVEHTLMILVRSEEQAECYHFGVGVNKKDAKVRLLNYLDLLYQFIKHFKREAKRLIDQERDKGFNIKETRGLSFIENDFFSPLLVKDPKIQKFLKLMLPLTAREQQCLALYKEGKTAQMTGALLGLSQRTVEFYFDNIKNKLGCQSKADLLQW